MKFPHLTKDDIRFYIVLIIYTTLLIVGLTNRATIVHNKGVIQRIDDRLDKLERRIP